MKKTTKTLEDQIRLTRWLIFIIIALAVFCFCCYISLKRNGNLMLLYNLSSEKIISNQINALNQRITDIYIWSGFAITLILGGFVLNWYNIKGIAKEQAENELKSLKDKYDEIEQKSIDVQTKLNSIIESVENAENK